MLLTQVALPLSSRHVRFLPVQVPQTSPQPLRWQAAPKGQLGWHWHCPFWHDVPGPQVPQLPPQPLSPQVLPVQFGWHTHVPDAEQIWPALQVPQLPPQKSVPQFRLWQ